MPLCDMQSSRLLMCSEEEAPQTIGVQEPVGELITAKAFEVRLSSVLVTPETLLASSTASVFVSGLNSAFALQLKQFL